jgi:hypothetical protein
MKNILIGVLTIGILILGYLFIKQKDKTVDFSNTSNTQQSSSLGNDDMDSQGVETKTYNADGFSFEYDASATLTMGTNEGETFYLVAKEGEVAEIIKMIPASKISEYCQYVEIKSTVMNGKNFTYCLSLAEPATTYIYVKGDKAIIVLNQGTRMGLSYSYINPASVEIN